jgi:hypothetical protein
MSKSISSLHLDIPDKERQELLVSLFPLAKGFVSGGGMALALQLNHRKSFDFGFFHPSPIPKKVLETLSQKIPIGNIAVDTSDELTVFTKNEVKITLLHYPFTDAYPLETFDNGLRLFSVKDIAIKKVYTIGRMGEHRDYFDLYTILKYRYINLPELIAETKKIYGSVFEEKIFLQQLVYFGDLLNFTINTPTKTLAPTPDAVKSYFEELAKKYLS